MNTIEYIITSAKWELDLHKLVRLQENIANRIANWENIRENIAIQKRIWDAMKYVKNEIENILLNEWFDE